MNALDAALTELFEEEGLFKAEPDGDEGGGDADGGHAEPDGDEPPMDAGAPADAGPDPMAGGAPPAGGAGGAGGDMDALKAAIAQLPPDQLQMLKQAIDDHLGGGAGGSPAAPAAPAGPPALGKSQMPYDKKAQGQAIMKSEQALKAELAKAQALNKQLQAQIKLQGSPALRKAITESTIVEEKGKNRLVTDAELRARLNEKFASLTKSEQALADSFMFNTNPSKDLREQIVAIAL